MKSPHEIKIKKKADEVIKILKKENYKTELLKNSWEEYCVTLRIKNPVMELGDIKVYYSPNKNSYKYVFKIYDEYEKNKLKRILSGDTQGVYKNKGIEIDVDGSYQNGLTGYGAIIRKDGNVIKELSGIVEENDVEGSRQIAGELQAAIEVVKWCEKNLINEITLYYDYNGVRKWAKGEWKTKKSISKNYADFMKDIKLKIHWVKIKSHTGVYWNEQADKLAGKSINN